MAVWTSKNGQNQGSAVTGQPTGITIYIIDSKLFTITQINK
jgi:hypothetical protein